MVFFALQLSLAGDLLADGISVADDLYLGVWSPRISKWETTVPVCVWSEDGNTLYRVSASGQASGNQFALLNDIGDSVNYKVFWHTGRRFRQRERLQPNTASRRVYTFDSSRQCIGGPSAEIRVRLNKREIDAAIPGIYNDSLLFILSPL